MGEIKEFWLGLKEGQKLFGEYISSIINTFLFSLIYFLGIGATSLVGKLFGKNFIELKSSQDSHWKELNLGKGPIEEYYRQF